MGLWLGASGTPSSVSPHCGTQGMSLCLGGPGSPPTRVLALEEHSCHVLMSSCEDSPSMAVLRRPTSPGRKQAGAARGRPSYPEALGKSWGLPPPAPSPSQILLCQVQCCEARSECKAPSPGPPSWVLTMGTVSAMCANLRPSLSWHLVSRLEALCSGLCFLLGCLPGPRIICFLTHMPPLPPFCFKPHPSLMDPFGFSRLWLQRICGLWLYSSPAAWCPPPPRQEKSPKFRLLPPPLQGTCHMSPWLKPQKLRDPCRHKWDSLEPGHLILLTA